MIIAILQARVSSSRLPSKVLKKILNKPMILWQIERINRSKLIDKLVLATSTERDDDPLESLCKIHKIDCFRGSLNNVLERYYHCAKKYQATQIVRLTGDCPIIDHRFIDELVNFHLKGQYDYSCNALMPTLPNGQDVEIMTFNGLKTAYHNASLPSEIEHVVPYITNNPNKFKLGSLTYPNDYSYMRWTVDEQEDFELIKIIIEKLYQVKEYFRFEDILKFLNDNRKLMDLNSKFRRNEGYLKSLEEDKLFLNKNLEQR